MQNSEFESESHRVARDLPFTFPPMSCAGHCNFVFFLLLSLSLPGFFFYVFLSVSVSPFHSLAGEMMSGEPGESIDGGSSSSRRNRISGSTRRRRRRRRTRRKILMSLLSSLLSYLTWLIFLHGLFSHSVSLRVVGDVVSEEVGSSKFKAESTFLKKLA